MLGPENRPVISEYEDPVSYIKDMIDYRKAREGGFSVLAATQSLRRISPTLVSLVLQRKRKITVERAEGFARLLNLNAAERIAFRNWVEAIDIDGETAPAAPADKRKDVGTSILNDWLNVYVKDFFQIPAVQYEPTGLNKLLAGIASPARVSKALQFLLREGHLRRTLSGRIVPETNLAVAEPRAPSRKVRQFHKAALGIARQALDLYPPEERLANTLIIPLDEKRYAEMMELVQEFAEKLKDFAARDAEPGNRLHQVIINVSPVGGKIE